MAATRLSWDAAEQQSRDDHAHVRYLDIACANCGRERVEQLANGKIVCEKCSWDQIAGDYDAEHLSLNQ